MEQDPKDYLEGITTNERKAKAREELEMRQKIHKKFHEDFKKEFRTGYHFEGKDRYERNFKKMQPLRDIINAPDSSFRVGKPFWHNWFKKK